MNAQNSREIANRKNHHSQGWQAVKSGVVQTFRFAIQLVPQDEVNRIPKLARQKQPPQPNNSLDSESDEIESRLLCKSATERQMDALEALERKEKTQAIRLRF